jgi:hypothetical protein
MYEFWSLQEWRKATTTFSYADGQKSGPLAYGTARSARQKGRRRTSQQPPQHMAGRRHTTFMRPTEAKP